MILYVNGDSHSHGCGLPVHQRYSNIVGKEFGFTVVNNAQMGASNASILRTTKQYFDNGNVPDFVIIGWSTWEREEWFFQNQYYNVNASGHDKLPEELQELYKKWVITQTQEVLTLKSNFWHDQIYQLHLDLKEKNIKHLFFNCMYNFFQFDNHQDWENKHIGPYNNNDSYYWWLKKQGFKSDKWYHYLEDGHRAWASHLITHIQKHKLL